MHMLWLRRPCVDHRLPAQLQWRMRRRPSPEPLQTPSVDNGGRGGGPGGSGYATWSLMNWRDAKAKRLFLRASLNERVKASPFSARLLNAVTCAWSWSKKYMQPGHPSRTRLMAKLASRTPAVRAMCTKKMGWRVSGKLIRGGVSSSKS
eukprot:186035-Prorocentrum_minimum.AAC.1